MKLKQWLKEYKQITYSDYKSLEDIERYKIEGEFNHFNNIRNKSKQTLDKIIKEGAVVRSLTPEESKRLKSQSELEKARYNTSLQIGGIDERGNYTALHHRH